jgi:hypothetical protein
MASALAKMPQRLCILGLTDLKSREAECADTAYVGTMRPCAALLGQRGQDWNARMVIARPITA